MASFFLKNNAQERKNEKQSHAHCDRNDKDHVRNGRHLVREHLEIRLCDGDGNAHNKRDRNQKAELRVLVSCEPIRSPMGIMAMSAPREKRAIPTIRSTEPTRKRATVPPVMGATEK